MFYRLTIAAAALAVAGAAWAEPKKRKELTPTDAAAGSVVDSEVLFGYQNVGFHVDRDTIKVGSEIGKFGGIRLRVLGNDIFMNELKVIYVDGTETEVPIAAEIEKNTRTKLFKIKGDRFIKEIAFSYRSKPNFKGQARVEVFGDYAPGWLGPNGEGRRYNQGWVLLGADIAGFFGYDTRTFSVGRNEGGFRNLRVTARNRAITLREVSVLYADGKRDTWTMHDTVEADKSYGPLDLKGKKAVIKEITARYRSHIVDTAATGKGKATVEIWGQH